MLLERENPDVMAGVYQGDDVLDVLGLVVLSLKTLQKKFCDSTNFGLYNA